jgi:CRP/FNR family transcriptional regulator
MISSSPIFQPLSKETMEEMAKSAIKKTYQAGEIIVHQEDVWPYLFLLAKGEINAVKESAGGRSFVATTLKPGDIFWGLAFFIENAPMPVAFHASADSEIYLWSREKLVPVIQSNGEVAWNLSTIMISRMQLASEIVDELAFLPVMGRLAGLLLEVFGEAQDEFVARDLTLDDMAARIGTTREVVCRHLYKFAEKGAIEIRRTELRINDRSFLEHQASRD